MRLFPRRRKDPGPYEVEGGSYVYTVTPPGEATTYVWSYLPHTMVFRIGLPPDGVIGFWDANWNGDLNSPAGFTRNRTFMDLFQRVMCAELLASPGIHEAAAERGSGEMMITDPRNPWVEQNMVLPEDFLGAFVITDGKISADTYVRNPGYRLIGHHGRFRLPPAQEAAIRAEVIRAVGQTPE